MSHSFSIDNIIEAATLQVEDLYLSPAIGDWGDEWAKEAATTIVQKIIPIIRNQLAEALKEERDTVVESCLRRGLEMDSAFLAGAKAGYDLSVTLVGGSLSHDGEIEE